MSKRESHITVDATAKMDVDKDEFYRKLYEMIDKQALNTLLFSRERYDRMLQSIKLSKVSTKKTPADYRRSKKYDVMDTPDGERIFATPTPSDKLRRRLMLVATDEMYDIIRDYHLRLNHGGRTRMMEQIKRKYKNITTHVVVLYLSLCQTCKNKVFVRNKPRSQLATEVFENIDENDTMKQSTIESAAQESRIDEAIRSYAYPELYCRGQVDILSVSNDSKDDYKYLMVYRNYVTKFTHLKSMKQLCVDETVDCLLEIFLLFGAPNILQSKNGIVIAKSICRRISSLSPDIKVVASDNIFSVNDFKRKSNEDILKMLNEWLIKTQNTRWHEGVKFVQHSLNTTFHEVLCRTPSEIVFGLNPRKGLVNVMSKNIYEDLVTEQDLIAVLEKESLEQAPKQICLEESLIMPNHFIKIEEEFRDEDSDEDFITT